MHRHILLATFLFLVAACAERQPPPSIAELEAFDFWIYAAFPKDLSDETSIKALGKLLGEEAVRYEAAHAEGKWNAKAYRFDGLLITAIVQEVPPHQALVSGITITSEAWPLKSGLRVGGSVSELALPRPHHDIPGKHCGVNNCIEVLAEQGRIREIKLSLYAE